MSAPAWDEVRIREVLNAPHESSSYQYKVYQHILAGKGDCLINAVAGSGKTSTILNACTLVTRQGRDSMFVAFGREIMLDINVKLKERGLKQSARTAHQLGMIALGRKFGKRLQPLQETKYHRLVASYVNGVIRPQMDTDNEHARHTLYELTRLARLTLTPLNDVAALLEMADHYSVDLIVSLDRKEMNQDQRDARDREEKRLQAFTLQGVKPIIDQGITVAQDQGLIDFTDMLYLPYVWSLIPYTSSVVFVDECQDLSAVQLDLVLKLRKPDGIMCFVGDPSQAIFGFAGASDQSFWSIADRTQSVQLPLSISYRCPKSHVALAQALVPNIEAREGAYEGIIATIHVDDVADMVKKQLGKCLIVCRLTAPLIELCLHLIVQRINAKVRGREIGTQLLHMVDDMSTQTAFTWDKFGYWIEAFRLAQIDRLLQKEGTENQIQALNDRVAAISACHQNFSETDLASLTSFKVALANLFADENPGVWLSTVHRAKGLEQEHVYILQPEKMPLVWQGQQNWEFQQEKNLRYVALTRSTKALYFLQQGKSDDQIHTDDDPDERALHLSHAITEAIVLDRWGQALEFATTLVEQLKELKAWEDEK